MKKLLSKYVHIREIENYSLSCCCVLLVARETFCTQKRKKKNMNNKMVYFCTHTGVIHTYIHVCPRKLFNKIYLTVVKNMEKKRCDLFFHVCLKVETQSDQQRK